jgi:hypothetical protein
MVRYIEASVIYRNCKKHDIIYPTKLLHLLKMAYGVDHYQDLQKMLNVQCGVEGVEGYPDSVSTGTDEVVESRRISNRGLAIVGAGLLLLSVLIGGVRQGAESVQSRMGSGFRMPFSGEVLHEGITGEQPQATDELPMLGNYGDGN